MKKIRKAWILVGGVAVVLALVLLAGCGSGGTFTGQLTTNGQQTGIWVSGQGKVTTAPDLATLTLGIEAQEKTVAQAQAEASDAMNKVMNVLTSNGIAQKDIQTQYFSIQQVTRWDDSLQKEVVIGYRVDNIVVAKIRTLDKVGTIIDAAAAAGGDLTRVQGVSFSIDNPSTYYGQARELAMADAKVKAQQLAQLSGVTLGKPTYINEYVAVPYPIFKEGAAVATPSPTTPISPGEIEVTLTVQVTYAIQ